MTPAQHLLRPRALVVGLLAAVGYVLVVGIPTVLIPNPVFSREIPPTWWSWPALLVTAVLVGALAASYVAPPPVAPTAGPDAQEDAADAGEPDEPMSVRGVAGGLLTFFAVGCPVCNKIVLLALGTSGAIAWFEPLQPLLQVAAVALLVWALQRRLSSLTACPTPTSKITAGAS